MTRSSREIRYQGLAQAGQGLFWLGLVFCLAWSITIPVSANEAGIGKAAASDHQNVADDFHGGEQVLAPPSGAENIENFSAQLYRKLQLNLPVVAAMDEESGQLLFTHERDQLHAIASITKLLAVYVLEDALADGKITLDTKVPVSPEVAALSRETDLSNVPLVASKDRYTVDELLDAVLVSSGNAATVALGELLAPDEAGFVQLMRDKLDELGLKDYEMYTASGINTDYGLGDIKKQDRKENKLTASGLLDLVQHLLKTYPNLRERTRLTHVDFAVDDQSSLLARNSNEFLPDGLYARAGVTGVKTGTEQEAGYCLVSEVEISGRKILLVSLGAGTHDQLYQETGRLIDALDEELTWVPLVKQGEVYLSRDNIQIYQGMRANVDLVYGEDQGVFLPNGQHFEAEVWQKPTEKFSYAPNGKLQVEAPLATDQPVNHVKTQLDFVSNRQGQPLELVSSLVPSQNVEELPLILRVTNRMNNLLDKVWEKFQQTFNTGPAGS